MKQRHGAALLEVLVALAILVIAGVALAGVLGENLRALHHARERDREMSAAASFLDAVSLWPREDLDRRLGWRGQGKWKLRIDRPESDLYVIALADSTAREILRTVLYRPEAPNGLR